MRIMSLYVLLGVSILFSGCKQEDGAAPATRRAQGDGAPLRVVYIPKNTGNPYFKPLARGVAEAAEEAGAEFAEVAPASGEATSQIPLIKDQVQLGVDVLIISVNSPDALVPVLEEARKKNVVVVTVDSDLSGNEQHRDAGVLPVAPRDVGYGQLEMLGKAIDYKGKFAILSATTDAPNQNAWIGHMKDAMKDPKYKQMELVAVVYGDDQPQKSTTEAEALLTKYPDLRGIIAPTSVGVAAAAQVVENAKKADQVKVVGLGLPSETKRYVQNGTLAGVALWDPREMGYVAGHLGVQLAQGKVSAAPGATFTAGKSGERQVGEKNVVIAGKPLVFTRENIEQYEF